MRQAHQGKTAQQSNLCRRHTGRWLGGGVSRSEQEGAKFFCANPLSSWLLTVFPIEQISPEYPSAKEPNEKKWHFPLQREAWGRGRAVA